MINYGTKYFSDFIDRTHIKDAVTSEAKWAVSKVYATDNNGNGQFEMEIHSVQGLEKMSINGWTFEKMVVYYDWGSSDAYLVASDSCGSTVKLRVGGHLGAANERSTVNNANSLNDCIISGVRKLKEIAVYNYADELTLSQKSLSEMTFQELIEWYEQVNRFKRRLPMTIQADLEGKFIKQLKSIGKDNNAQ